MPKFDKFPLAAPGWPYVLGGLALTIYALALDFLLAAFILGCCTVFIISFFRDPARISSLPPEAVLAPADGRVVVLEVVDCPDLPEGRAQLVSIFMNLFNVHVNRLPVSGQIIKVERFPGRFRPADEPQARLDNERLSVAITTNAGKTLLFTQVAGLVARRIHCRLLAGDHVQRGERYGMIRFGSRVDLYLPLDCKISLQIGDVTKAGITQVGVF